MLPRSTLEGAGCFSDLDLCIMVVLILRSDNVFVNIGRNRNIHRSSAAQPGPSDASIWPIVRRLKGYGQSKENNFQLCCLVETQIISKQATFALIEKQMSSSLSRTHWFHHSNFCRKQAAYGYNKAYLKSLTTNPNHAYPPFSGRPLSPPL